MPNDITMSPLYKALIAQDKQAFTAELANAVREGNLPHDTSQIISELARQDNGAQLKEVLDASYTIEAERAERSSLQAQLKSGEIDTAPHVALNFRSVMNYAGLGENQGQMKTAFAMAAMQSKQFLDDIREDGEAAAAALSNLMIRKGDQSGRAKIIFNTIERVAPDNVAAIARRAILGSMHAAALPQDPHCFKSGERTTFEAVAAKLDQQGVDDVLSQLLQRQDGGGGEFEARQKMIMERASKEALRAAQKTMASGGSKGAFDALSEQLGDADPKESLMAACGPNMSDAKKEQADARSLDNLKTLMKHEFDEDTIFTAMQACIENRKDKHLAELLDYARDKFPDVAKRPTPDHSTLLIKALTLKNGKEYDRKDNPMVERMGYMLLELKTSAQPDRLGNQPLSILAERGMEHSGLYVAVKKAMENEIDIQYAGARVLAELQAKLAIAQQMKSLGFGEQVIAAIMGGSAAPAQQPEPPLPPRAIGTHTGRVVVREQENEKPRDDVPG